MHRIDHGGFRRGRMLAVARVSGESGALHTVGVTTHVAALARRRPPVRRSRVAQEVLCRQRVSSSAIAISLGMARPVVSPSRRALQPTRQTLPLWRAITAIAAMPACIRLCALTRRLASLAGVASVQIEQREAAAARFRRDAGLVILGVNRAGMIVR